MLSRGTKRARVSTDSDFEHQLSPTSSSSPVFIDTSCSTKIEPLFKTKKPKYATLSSETPFPTHLSPTLEESSDVHIILTKAHPEYTNRPRAPVEDQGNSAATCGKVANVLDSLIGTILSQNTSARNSTAAKQNLDATFGLHGFAAIANAPYDTVVDAIRSGGLANRKATIIQSVLRNVYERHGTYSLQHLSELSDSAATAELVAYAGVGPKTAACVLAFSLQRDSFAVDTHVFRLSKMLRWVPSTANRVQTQAHLEIRLPSALKYELHVLMVAHGRACKGCKQPDLWQGTCILKSYLRGQQRLLKKNDSGDDGSCADLKDRRGT